jgi:AcrR family transcriptional regulator
MVKKIPNARAVFEKAAMELFQERGYAETTVPDIAARAGHTERSFYRYFADKPEVLFWRASELQTQVTEAINQAPIFARPLEAVVTAFEGVAIIFDGRRTDANTRRTLIAAHPEFQERETMKMRSLTSGIDEALRARGVPAAAARMTAEAGVAVFRVAFERWSRAQGSQSFREFVRTSLRELNAVVLENASDGSGSCFEG